MPANTNHTQSPERGSAIGRNPVDNQFTHREVPPGLIKSREIQRLASVSDDTVRKWVRSGALTPVVLPSGGLRYKRSEVETLLGLDRTDGSDQ